MRATLRHAAVFAMSSDQCIAATQDERQMNQI